MKPFLFTRIVGAFWLCTAANFVYSGQASTIDQSRQSVYAANCGWINFNPIDNDGETPDHSGAVFGESYLTGYIYAANTGWINLGQGPVNNLQYSNASAGDCGVNHDGSGNLSGWAWSPEIGWISFSWTDTSDDNRPRVDLQTGVFHGFAWGTNVGWINLGTNQLATESMIVTDSDTDGLGDQWEMEHFENLTSSDGSQDADNDGASDGDEYLADTNPNLASEHGTGLEIVEVNLPDRTASLRVAHKTSRIYRLESTSDLQPGSWTPHTNTLLIPEASGNHATVDVNVSDGAGSYERRFFRIIPGIPLAPDPAD